jgi:hypothetical protein
VKAKALLERKPTSEVAIMSEIEHRTNTPTGLIPRTLDTFVTLNMPSSAATTLRFDLQKPPST